MTTKKIESAVSPVIGILLMIVVTVIIAAVVTGFASSLVNTNADARSAQISSEFSISNGWSITHIGGDDLPTKNILITVRNSDVWGPGAEEKTVQVVNKTNITTKRGDFDVSAKPWQAADGTVNITSFKAGDTYYVSPWNCTGWILQPDEAPGGWSTTYPSYTYSGSKMAFWALCFRNPDNIGRSFLLDISDATTGKKIASTRVPIVA
jgi:archaeal type IV pilus assembly protein PilA